MGESEGHSGPAPAGGEGPPSASARIAEADDKVLAAYLAEGLAEDSPEERDLGARYDVTGRLGSGGQGIVLEGRDGLLDREVAVKVLRNPGAGIGGAGGAGAGGAGGAAELLRAEARLTGSLEHPGVPPVYDLAEDASGSPFVVMRKVEGVSLEAVLQVREGAATSPSPAERSLRQLISAFLQMGQTVAYAHSLGVLHLDLKPANIKLGRWGEVFVLDWGFAARKDDKRTFRGGTPIYASPEQIRGARCDERADVYALGVILYRILGRCNHVDFPYDGLDEYLHMLESTFPKGLRSRGAGVSRELDAVVMKAIARRRDDRYASVGEFLSDLERALEDQSVAALAEGASSRARRLLGRLALPAALAVAVFVALAGSWFLAYRIGRLGRPDILLAQEPGPANPRRARARLPFERALVLAGSAAGRADALALLDRAVEIDPGFAEALAARGRLKRISGDAAGALDDLRASSRLDPSRTSSRYMAGLTALTEMNDPAAARADFDAIGEVGPSDDLRRLGLARLALDRGDADEALRLSEQVARDSASYSELWRIRGSVHADPRSDCFDPGLAASEFAEAMRLEGRSRELLSARAGALAAAGRTDEALADIAAARRLPGEARLDRALARQEWAIRFAARFAESVAADLIPRARSAAASAARLLRMVPEATVERAPPARPEPELEPEPGPEVSP